MTDVFAILLAAFGGIYSQTCVKLPYEPQRDKTSLRTFGRYCGKTLQMRENHVICVFKIMLYLYALNIIAPN